MSEKTNRQKTAEELLSDYPWVSGVPAREIARRLGIDRRTAAYIKGRAEGREEAPEACRYKDKHPSILVIGDAHFEPGQELDRAAGFGRYIRDHLDETDYVVCIGDWFGLTSLCSYNSAKQREGYRLADDLAAGNEAIAMMMAEIPVNRCPQLFFVVGNHEVRLNRLAAERPEFSGVVGLGLMDWEKYGWEVVPFLQPLRLFGVRFQHYMTHGGGRAISGVNTCRNILKRVQYSESVVVGHNHLLMMEQSASALGGRRWAVTVGCAFDHEEEYAGGDSNAAWWAGLVRLRNVRNGDFDLEAISLDTLRDLYSDED